jgi:4-amino-4-deoxy-L-arabinose transferase-like glycosyltransferase
MERSRAAKLVLWRRPLVSDSNINSRTFWSDIAILALICLVTFWWQLGRLGLTDPDEPFYAQTSREMLTSGDWITPHIYGAPQFEKPILFYWLGAWSLKAFGVNEFAARLPSALAATLLVIMAYTFGRSCFGRLTGLATGLFLSTALGFVLMARLMLTDMVFAAFVSASLFCLWQAVTDESRRTLWLVLHFTTTALAVMTKGPLGSIIPALAAIAYRVATRRPLPFRGAGLWIGLAVYTVIVVPWFAVMLWKFGWEYFHAFFIHENLARLIRAEHPRCNHVWFYPAILFAGSIPWLALVPVMLARVKPTCQRHDAARYIWCWFGSSLIFLTIAQSKLHSYCLFLFVPVGVLVGLAFKELADAGYRHRAERWLVLGLGLAQAIAVAVGLAVYHYPVTAVLLGVILLTGWVLQLRRHWLGWAAANIAGVLTATVFALQFLAPRIEQATSVRQLAARLADVRTADVPVLCSQSLARGLYFYSGQTVNVVANKPQPFYSPHALPIIVGKQGLNAFLDQHPRVIGVFTGREWNNIRSLRGLAQEENLHLFGPKVLVQFNGREVKQL